MYNMGPTMLKFEINILGIKCNLLLLLVCFLLGCLLGTFVLCSCCKISFLETLKNLDNNREDKVNGSSTKSRNLDNVGNKYLEKNPIPSTELVDDTINFFNDTNFRS